MRKVLLTILLIASTVGLYAQSAAQQADKAFAAGNYSDATQLYELAASTSASSEAERNRLYEAANKCRKLVSLHAKANNACKAQDYETAVSLYTQILKYNPKDARALKRKKEFALDMENAIWGKMSSCVTFAEKAQCAQEYLKKYPSGRFKEEAKSIVTEEELWQNARNANTYEAYQSYILNSSLQAYADEVNEIVAAQENAVWSSVKNANSKVAYYQYIKQYPNGKYVKEAKGSYNVMCARDAYYAYKYSDAYSYYLATDDQFLTSSDRTKMNACLEYILYKKACDVSGTISDCRNYLSKFEYGATNYYSVEKKMMTLLCEEGRFDEAMLYARYDSHKDYVKKAERAWRKKNR